MLTFYENKGQAARSHTKCIFSKSVRIYLHRVTSARDLLNEKKYLLSKQKQGTMYIEHVNGER